jgi:dipeptidyl-peptidase-4
MSKRIRPLLVLWLFLPVLGNSQGGIKWSVNPNNYYKLENGEIVSYVLPAGSKTVLVSKQQLTPSGTDKPLVVANYIVTADSKRVLIFTNTRKVWRGNTKGDYWIIDLAAHSIHQLGKNRPVSSLMFAKLSPDCRNAAYVSEYNLYVEDIVSGSVKALTQGGNRKLINGTFDWAYEEEFGCRDGFRWSPDSKQLAYWQVDARKVKDHLMVNNTQGVYPVIVSVEYPVAGDLPSPCRIGVVNVSSAKTTWMNIPSDPKLGSYIPRMEWAANSYELIIQHLSRRQNETQVMLCDVKTGKSNTVYLETDAAWIDPIGSWNWLSQGREFLWLSEKDGWRHLYRVSRDGKKETLVTKGNFDVIDISTVDDMNGYVYFFASPENATQKYLYRTKLDGTSIPERLSPSAQAGWHNYNVSPDGKFSWHSFTNHYTPLVNEWVTLPAHSALGAAKVSEALSKSDPSKVNVELFKVTTSEGVVMDGWMAKPENFDSSKKYPVVFYVYTEPLIQEVLDKYGIAYNFLYPNMAKDGYFYIAIDNRGAPAPKGREWRKSLYQKIGQLNISEILKWPYIDTSRVAVWGWSGGAAATLHLLCQYPDIYKTGVAVSAVGNLLTYDNIYQERYTGLPQESMDAYTKGSPIANVKNLKGNLLYVHGTGDDNVHYNNAEMLLNELIKYNKQFSFMAYPNRTHSISEGEGTSLHMSTMFMNFIKQYCPPGPR